MRRARADCKQFLIASLIYLVHGGRMSKTKSKTRTKLGRPAIPEEERRKEWIGAAVSTLEKKQFQLRAAQAQVHESLFLRDLCGFTRRPGEGEKKEHG
jgi:hypothetical protein